MDNNREQLIEEMQQFIDSIPMEELYSELRRVTGLSDLKFTKTIKTDRWGYPYISISSQDLVDKVGFLKLIFAEIYVKTFNSSIKQEENDPHKFYYWCTIDFDYTHPGGGHNGKTFYQAVYRHDAWEFAEDHW